MEDTIEIEEECFVDTILWSKSVAQSSIIEYESKKQSLSMKYTIPYSRDCKLDETPVKITSYHETGE